MKNPKERGALKDLEQFGAVYAATEESWTGQSRARTIVDENLAFSFTSGAGEARWIAAGRPPLETADGTSTKPATSNYAMTFRYGPGHGLTVDQMKRLPASPAALSRVLRKMWDSLPDDPANPDGRQQAVGEEDPTFADYVGAWADAVLGGPTTPGTQAAMYRLLAEQPNVTIVRGVTDPLGRTGVAIGADGEYLIIDPHNAQLLASTTRPVHARPRNPHGPGEAWTSSRPRAGPAASAPGRSSEALIGFPALRPLPARSGSGRAGPATGALGREAGQLVGDTSGMGERNVLGGELEPCGDDPVTGFYRDGCCNTGPEDLGSHTICAVVTAEFLEHQRRIGNDLSTPVPQYRFPGPGARGPLVRDRGELAACPP